MLRIFLEIYYIYADMFLNVTMVLQHMSNFYNSIVGYNECCVKLQIGQWSLLLLVTIPELSTGE